MTEFEGKEIMNMNAYDKAKKAAEIARKITSFEPEIAIVLGSGLGDLADAVEVEAVLDPRIVPGSAVDPVPGHKGVMILGRLAGKNVVIQSGRIHYYQGYRMEDVVLPVRLMCLLGAKKVILTNAAGGVNLDYAPGDFMAIRDHISTFVPSPLIGGNDEAFGERFPDMSEIYSLRLIALAKEGAQACGATMREGVYLQTSGPNYETPAEIRMFRTLGADAVGMSTTVEAIAAKHMGREILGISLITNPAAGVTDRPLSHDEVRAAGESAKGKFRRMIEYIVERM